MCVCEQHVLLFYLISSPSSHLYHDAALYTRSLFLHMYVHAHMRANASGLNESQFMSPITENATVRSRLIKKSPSATG